MTPAPDASWRRWEAASFVGRERELESLRGALLAGRNVVVAGAFGIGRSTLLRQLGRVAAAELGVCFADFSRTPAAACRELAAQLLPARQWRSLRAARYGAVLGALVQARLERKRLRVLVLDDVVRVTPAKLRLVKLLADNPSWRIAAIVESFLPRAELGRLVTWLYPVERLVVDRLGPRDSREYFRRVAAAGGLDWSERKVAALARRCGGYPLEMRRVAASALGADG